MLLDSIQASRIFVAAALLLTLSLSGCQIIGAVEVATTQARFFLKPNGTRVTTPAEAMLSASQNQALHEWLGAHRSGWSSRYDTSTLPDWCLHINLEKHNTTSLCRYTGRVVLRGLGPEIQRSLTDADKAFFAQQIERLNT